METTQEGELLRSSLCFPLTSGGEKSFLMRTTMFTSRPERTVGLKEAETNPSMSSLTIFEQRRWATTPTMLY